MILTRYCSALFFIAGTYCEIQAQNLVIQGKITDLVSSQPLVYVSITLDNTIKYTSDTSGFYRIKTAPGKHRIKISRVDYKNYEVTVDEDFEGIKELNVELEPFSNQLEQVVVAGSRSEKKIAREVMSVNLIKPYLIANTNA